MNKKHFSYEKLNRIVAIALPIFAVLVAILNFSLAFDNVLWGDEAYSANTVRDVNFFGVFERIYWWDAHPPLYYAYLWLVTRPLGSAAWALHMASLIPFATVMVLCCTVIKKRFGVAGGYLGVLLCGLSYTCVTYNLEVRMYALLFLELFVACIFSYKILAGDARFRNWIFAVLACELAAYTHYLGCAAAGILLFFLGVWFFAGKRTEVKRAWLYGTASVASFIVLYIPWMPGFIRQATSGGNWWREKPDSLSMVKTFVFFGDRMSTLLFPMAIVGSLLVLIVESDIFSLVMREDGNIEWRAARPGIKKWSIELKIIMLFWTVIVAFLCFGYAVSYTVSPLILARYTYPLVPFALIILMCIVKRVGTYAGLYESEKSVSEEVGRVHIRAPKENFTKKMVLYFACGFFFVLLGMGLLDFKLFRSETKVQDAETAKITNMIGTPSDTTVFDAVGVRHLSWTVLKYYYPDSEILANNPDEILPSAETENIDNIWLFINRTLYEGEKNCFNAEGFVIEEYADMWFGIYPCNVIHIFK